MKALRFGSLSELKWCVRRLALNIWYNSNQYHKNANNSIGRSPFEVGYFFLGPLNLKISFPCENVQFENGSRPVPAFRLSIVILHDHTKSYEENFVIYHFIQN